MKLTQWTSKQKKKKKSVRETTKFIQNLYISIQFEIPLNLFHFDYIASIE